MKRIKKKAKIFKIKKVKKWGELEDSLIEKQFFNKRRQWKSLLSEIKNKSTLDIVTRYKAICYKQGKWAEEEDELLLRLHSKHGNKWSQISQEMKERNWKQVRDRYINQLDPKLLKTPFTMEEDVKVYDLFKQLKTKWTKYPPHLPGRSADNIKTRYYSCIKGKDLKMRLYKQLGSLNVNYFFN